MNQCDLNENYEGKQGIESEKFRTNNFLRIPLEDFWSRHGLSLISKTNCEVVVGNKWNLPAQSIIV